jgi:N-acetylglucosaminyl-diphospho-decaprenol L-rhamnosyltransferase
LSRLAVVVVTHDSTGVLGATLAALAPQLRSDDELVIVDCASSDDPRPLVPSGARFVALDKNLGFAGGAAMGALETSAPLLFFLNPDAVPAEGCLDAIREAPAGWGAWQALVLLPGGERVNTSGNVVHFLGFGWAGGHEAPVASVPSEPVEVGFASGAALAVRRAAWDDVGGFDPAFFMYGEDLDVSLRLRLAGWRVGLAPAARVEHAYEFDKGDYKWFHLERNRWWIVLGTYPAPLLALLAPALLLSEVALLAVAGRGGWLRAKLRAQLAVLRTLPMALRRRRAIQARRSDARGFVAGLSSSLDSPFLGPVARVAVLRSLQAGYWRAVRGALGA